MLFIIKNDNELQWLDIDVTDNGQIRQIQRSDDPVTDQAPRSWEVMIDPDKWPEAVQAYDPEDKMPVLLTLHGAELHKISFRRIAYPDRELVIPNVARQLKDGEWQPDMAHKALANQKGWLQSVVPTDLLTIPKRLEAHVAAFYSTYGRDEKSVWDDKRKEGVSDAFELVANESVLTGLQRQMMEAVVAPDLLQLKRGSVSEAEFCAALLAVINGCVGFDWQRENGISDITFANAIALRSSLNANRINMLPYNAFYAGIPELADRTMTVADVQLFILTALKNTILQHQPDQVVTLPTMHPCYRVPVGTLGEQEQPNRNLSDEAYELFRIMNQALQSGSLVMLSSNHQEDVLAFYDALRSRNLVNQTQLDAANHLVAVLQALGRDYEAEMNELDAAIDRLRRLCQIEQLAEKLFELTPSQLYQAIEDNEFLQGLLHSFFMLRGQQPDYEDGLMHILKSIRKDIVYEFIRRGGLQTNEWELTEKVKKYILKNTYADIANLFQSRGWDAACGLLMHSHQVAGLTHAVKAQLEQYREGATHRSRVSGMMYRSMSSRRSQTSAVKMLEDLHRYQFMQRGEMGGKQELIVVTEAFCKGWLYYTHGRLIPETNSDPSFVRHMAAISYSISNAARRLDAADRPQLTVRHGLS